MKSVFEGFNFIIIRLISAVVSFVFFSIIATGINQNISNRVLIFYFTLGFWINSLRMLLHLKSKIDTVNTKRDGLINYFEALSIVNKITLITMPIFLSIIWFQTNNIYITIFSGLTCYFSVQDFDLVRSLFKKTYSFPLTFLLGSLVSIIAVYFSKNTSFFFLAFWTIFQWSFVMLYNIIKNIKVKNLFNKYRLPKNLGIGFSLYTLTVFDGFILNFPFLNIVTIEDKYFTDYVLSIRIFSSSLIFQPLLLHWLNSRSLNYFIIKLKFSKLKTFFILLFFSGMIVGCPYFLLFQIISNKNLTIIPFVLFVLLLFGYSIYFSTMRILANSFNNSERINIILVAIIFFLSMIFLANYFQFINSFIILYFQLSSFLLASFLLKRKKLF